MREKGVYQYLTEETLATSNYTKMTKLISIFMEMKIIFMEMKIKMTYYFTNFN